MRSIASALHVTEMRRAHLRLTGSAGNPMADNQDTRGRMLEPTIAQAFGSIVIGAPLRPIARKRQEPMEQVEWVDKGRNQRKALHGRIQFRFIYMYALCIL